MATSKPRITITLEPRIYEVVNRLARANGQSMSRVIAEFLDVAEGQMQRAVRIIEAAHGASDQAKEGVRKSLKRAESALVPALLEALNQQELELGELVEESGLDTSELREYVLAAERAGREKRSAGQAAERPEPPRHVIRGVGTPTKGKGHARGPGKKGVKRA